MNTDPFGVAFGQDGAYWISRFQGNDLLRLTTGGQVTTLGGFSAAAGPRKIATGPGNTLWTTLDLAEKIGRVSGVEPPPPPPPRPAARAVARAPPRRPRSTRARSAR